MSEFAGGAVIAGIASTTATEIVETAESFIPEKTRKNFQDTFNDLIAGGNALRYQDPSFLINRRNEKEREKLAPETPSNNTDEATKYVDPDTVQKFGGDHLLVNEARLDHHIHGLHELSGIREPLAEEKVTSAELARSIIGFSTAVAINEGDVAKTMKESGDSVINKLGTFIADKALPNTEEFKEIKAVYNGRSINADSFSIARNDQGLVEITGVNELGEIYTLEQTTGIIIPAYPGTVFVGPRSPNDSLPTDNVFDQFSFFHDVSYENGPNHRGDLIFVSRLSQNLDRVPPDYKNIVNSTIVYFSTAGLLVSSVFGSLDPVQATTAPMEQMTTDDVFWAFNPQARNLPPRLYQEARYEYYNQFAKDMDDVSESSSLYAITGRNNTTKLLAKEFGEILIQII